MKTLNADLLVLSLCLVMGTRRSAAAKTEYNIQHGQCSYTFLLPEPENCQSQSDNYPVQKDGPMDQDGSAQRLEQLEMTMENNTQWLLKVTLHHIRWLSYHSEEQSSRGDTATFIISAKQTEEPNASSSQTVMKISFT